MSSPTESIPSCVCFTLTHFWRVRDRASFGLPYSAHPLRQTPSCVLILRLSRHPLHIFCLPHSKWETTLLTEVILLRMNNASCPRRTCLRSWLLSQLNFDSRKTKQNKKMGWTSLFQHICGWKEDNSQKKQESRALTWWSPGLFR